MKSDPRDSSTPRTVADLMSREVITIASDASVQELAALLSRHGVSGVPVVDEEGELIGTVSVTDILWHSDRLAPLLGGRAPTGSDEPPSVDLGTVGEIMTPDVFGLEPSASIQELLRFFSRTGLHRAPVVEGKRPVGIVSASDLLDLIAAAGDEGA
ncbi:MAG: CBS domain-containing protein [Gemmatimonadetes bacterium]|nr:CBS domain-containing protein [Gemmatimonadota bacterium]NIR79956.1 CBS domain-containing protein [Gemmatimonadota bacterium]NIT88681.1 CBS domain-containing protein [Gemmatimonadota bacterium]NIU32492.1 CBS domain-containing protein [Gemmatimonadota bacterium]NIU36973.1 CBS domain-containing protein [Gemmatimonadota bacterium]